MLDSDLILYKILFVCTKPLTHFKYKILFVWKVFNAFLFSSEENRQTLQAFFTSMACTDKLSILSGRYCEHMYVRDAYACEQGNLLLLAFWVRLKKRKVVHSNFKKTLWISNKIEMIIISCSRSNNNFCLFYLADVLHRRTYK